MKNKRVSLNEEEILVKKEDTNGNKRNYRNDKGIVNKNNSNIYKKNSKSVYNNKQNNNSNKKSTVKDKNDRLENDTISIEIIKKDKSKIKKANEEVKNVKEIDSIKGKDDNNSSSINEKKKKVVKKKRKLSKGEKIFLLINILIIIGIMGFYAYRAVYYYKLSHQKGTTTLKEKLISLDNIAYQNDGLYKKNDYYYYKGMNVNNYVYYSGRLFRIIDIENGIRMIDSDTSTNLIWGMDSDYNNSLIHSFLKDYLKSLKDYEVYLEQNKWCNEKIDVSNYLCNNVINDYVGLISTDKYLQAGGKNSYLNNNSYYWTINQDIEGKPLFVNKEGSINNISSSEDNFYSYSVRPVITLKSDVMLVGGEGKENNPFVIENLGNALLRDNSVGSFVKYHNQDFRIISIDDDGIKMMLNNPLDVELSYKEINKYLNNEYLNTLNKDDLVEFTYSINEYNYANKYDYLSEINNNKAYVTIPKISDLFLNNTSNYWLNNVNDKKLHLMYLLDENKMFFSDLEGNKHLVRPIIKLNSETVVRSGLGTINDPLLIGDENV